LAGIFPTAGDYARRTAAPSPVEKYPKRVHLLKRDLFEKPLNRAGATKLPNLEAAEGLRSYFSWAT
jgi:hypothetical protein